MAKCELCNSELIENSKFCPECGAPVAAKEPTEEAPTEMITNEPEEKIDTDSFTEATEASADNVNAAPAPEQTKKPKNKKAISLISILGTVIAVAVGNFVGEYLGKSMVENHREEEAIEEITAYKEESMDYVPGTVSGNTYTSEYFGFKIEYNDKWEMYSESDLAAATAAMESSVLSSTEAELRAQGMSEEVIEKYKETVYSKVETGASCIGDYIYIGDVTAMVFSSIGIEEYNSKDFLDEMIMGEALLGTDYTTGTEYIAGTFFDYIELTVPQENFTTVNRMYITKKGSAFCMITVIALSESKDEVFEEFRNIVSAI
ncbi:MAG: zinc ribbon domain-containing protein [Clostridia bacterium]|nr:zinc ribbon domain-containing protein [Clostridia bacterium]